MPKKLTMLHTAPANVTTFGNLLQEMAPDIPAEHILDESVLYDARTAGEVTPAVAARIEAKVLSADPDAALVLCTCSTIGGAAEQITHPNAGPVMRVDRAMAERAVALGDNILVVAALASTLAPTRDLILEAAKAAGKTVQVSELVCEGSWAKFEQGDTEAYWQAIADCLHRHAHKGEVVVLAQASMAGAADLCHDLDAPVLNSPRLGLEAAIKAYREATAQP